jgi:hypothetical protein
MLMGGKNWNHIADVIGNDNEIMKKSSTGGCL